MDLSFDISDSTDWLPTPLSSLSRVESALRCQVCKDFFNNPVITSCCHTFCSLCIRRCLSAEGKCPTCRADDQEVKLRQNWVVDELVDSFKKARESVLEFARRASTRSDDGAEEERTPKKRKINERESDGQDYLLPKETARTPRKIRSQSARQCHGTRSSTPMVIDDSEDDDYHLNDGLVPCPGCQRRMKVEAVYPHLDNCPGPSSQNQSQQPNSLLSLSSPRKSTSSSQPPERLPTINYSLMKDNVLRKKLRDLGIPDSGPKPLLQRRHTEWVNLCNANCDSKHPKSKRELLRELDVWERSQGGQASSISRDQTSSIMRKDFDGAAWSAAHEDDFKKLIENARQKRETGVSPAAELQPENQEKLQTPTTNSSDPGLRPQADNLGSGESSQNLGCHSSFDSNSDARTGIEGGSQRIVVEDPAA
ncbi:E3 ubiquitin-protein ligase rad18 [Emydomyces testavorans]|uniref:Postreplication repair E3 ubiquitin-protein ligase RAD18 n=1 Tax=Emydomyces testavorans TaxID=2070801 RepID=A0AAF0INU4_9EURO|nr:E3 ubiquitin-protein ligase rad18 [Emydomyces testavorans]